MDLILNAEKTNRHIKVAKAQKRDSVVRTWTLYWADQSHILILQLKNSHRRWRNDSTPAKAICPDVDHEEVVQMSDCGWRQWRSLVELGM